jgi:hypothetical protein
MTDIVKLKLTNIANVLVVQEKIHLDEAEEYLRMD